MRLLRVVDLWFSQVQVMKNQAFVDLLPKYIYMTCLTVRSRGPQYHLRLHVSFLIGCERC